MNDTELLLTLTHTRGITQPMAARLLRQWGSATAVYDHLDELPEDVRDAIATNGPTAQRRIAEELEFCTRHNISILPIDSPDYPKRLQSCPDAPLVLFYNGSAPLNVPHVISIVGTRKISEYGKSVCKDLCSELSSLLSDCLIVSGLAYGVDIHAHRACLENSLPTVGVLAHGLDRIYPSMHRQTAIKMMNHGGLLTEYLTGTNPDKGNFVRRNRIVAGIADATIVIESPSHGGSLITASIARQYDRRVFAVPGRLTDDVATGCNHLIRTGEAEILTSAQDVLDSLQWQAETTARTPMLFPELTPQEESILEIMNARETIDLNELTNLVGVKMTDIFSILMMMEMKHLVRLLPGNRVSRI